MINTDRLFLFAGWRKKKKKLEKSRKKVKLFDAEEHLIHRPELFLEGDLDYMEHTEEKKPLIRVDHVRKVYRMGQEKVVALNHVSLDIYKGEIVCFLGTSGSGKSTFLNMVAGLEKPTKGEIWIGGIPIHKLNEEKVTMFRQKNIGFIFQAYHLMPMLTAVENVSLPLIFRGVDKRHRNKMSKEILAAVGLKGYEKRKPSQMSGGQQQRVGIARALVGNPKIIFADEPTGNLDTHTTKDVMNLISHIIREHGQTLILVTHDRTIASYADRIVTIQDGDILNVSTNASEIPANVLPSIQADEPPSHVQPSIQTDAGSSQAQWNTQPGPLTDVASDVQSNTQMADGPTGT